VLEKKGKVIGLEVKGGATQKHEGWRRLKNTIIQIKYCLLEIVEYLGKIF
jgi:hypothetical protein